MKKFFTGLLIVTFIIACVGCFSGCFNKEEDKTEVSTLKELLNSGGNLVLTQDIDCDFTTVSGVVCKSFDGNGHTIKNAVLNGNAFFPLINNTPQYTSTFEDTSSIKNVTFENITCRSASKNASIVAGSYYGIEMENVTVKDSVIEIQEGNSELCCGIFVDCLNSRGSGIASFKNCVAENVKVKIGAPSESALNSSKKWDRLYFGGLIGYGIDVAVESCSIKNCDISIIGNCSNGIYAGGLVGYFDEYREITGSITDSFVRNTQIYVNSPNASLVMGMVAKTSDVWLGGLAGYYKTTGSILQSYSSDNELTVNCSGKAKIGGLVGYFDGVNISSSYSSNNYICGTYREVGDKAHVVAGLAAVAKNCAVTSCFTFNNIVRTDSSNYIKVSTGSNGKHYLNDTSYSVIAGFIGSVNKVSVIFCGANNILRDAIHNIDGEICNSEIEYYGLNIDDKLDEFTFGGTLTNCYVTEPLSAANSQNLDVISESVWYTNEIKTILNLVGSNWVLSDENPPRLALS